jgi:hypothetical protein
MPRGRAVILIAVFLALAGAMTVAALAAEPRVRRDLSWPLAPLNDWRGGAFRADPESSSVDLDALAVKARHDLPGCVAFVDKMDDEPILVVGPRAGSWDLGPLERWRDGARLPLLDPDPIGLSESTPSWFSAPRRGHDLAVAGAAIVVTALIVLATRRRPALAS